MKAGRQESNEGSKEGKGGEKEEEEKGREGRKVRRMGFAVCHHTRNFKISHIFAFEYRK